MKVDKNKCIGCGACVGVCPNVFDFGDDGLAEVKEQNIKEEDKESANEAMEYCPVGAITEE